MLLDGSNDGANDLHGASWLDSDSVQSSWGTEVLRSDPRVVWCFYVDTWSSLAHNGHIHMTYLGSIASSFIVILGFI